MPDYTRPWDNNLPDGTITPASQSDDEIRNLREDIQQRMDDLVADWETDPVELPTSKAVAVAKRYVYNQTAASPKAQQGGAIRSLLVIRYNGQTNAAGNIILSFSEFGEVFNLADPGFSNLYIASVVLYVLSDNDFLFAVVTNVDAINGFITLSIRKFDGALKISKLVRGTFVFMFDNIPT